MFNLLFESPFLTVVRALSVLAAITIHEYFHGLAADKMGDPTPRINGRLTLNPIKHLDPFGTLSLFFLGIGWAKPVPVDPFNFRDKKRDMALVSLAGPASNILSAVLASLLIRFLLPLTPLSYSALTMVGYFLFPFIAVSVGLAVFNLIPVPPLDGSKILFSLLPNRLAYEWEETMERYGLIILMLLIFPLFGGQSLIMPVISPVITFIRNFLL